MGAIEADRRLRLSTLEQKTKTFPIRWHTSSFNFSLHLSPSNSTKHRQSCLFSFVKVYKYACLGLCLPKVPIHTYAVLLRIEGTKHTTIAPEIIKYKNSFLRLSIFVAPQIPPSVLVFSVYSIICRSGFSYFPVRALINNTLLDSFARLPYDLWWANMALIISNALDAFWLPRGIDAWFWKIDKLLLYAICSRRYCKIQPPRKIASASLSNFLAHSNLHRAFIKFAHGQTLYSGYQ